MRRIPLFVVSLILSAPALYAQVHDPAAVASAILNGYRAQDLTVIAPHSNAVNERFFERLLSGAEDPSELWDGTRGAAGTGWDGMILPVRYNGAGEAIIPFAIEAEGGPTALGSGAAGRYMAIVLTLDGPDDTTWGFEDINYIGRSAYAGMSETR